MRCPRCHNRVLQKSGEDVKLRTRGPITISADGMAHAECYWCHETIVIPVQLSPGAEVPPPERFIFRG